jgi:hypothetical protein
MLGSTINLADIRFARVKLDCNIPGLAVWRMAAFFTFFWAQKLDSCACNAYFN